MPLGRIGSAARRLSLRQAGLGVGAVALAVSGLFGGLNRGTAQDVPTVNVGVVNHGGPWNVTVTRVRLIGDTPPLYLKNKGDRWLVVLATIEVTADASRDDAGD